MAQNFYTISITRLRLGANCVNFLSSVCKLLNPITTTLLYSNLILIMTFKKD